MLYTMPKLFYLDLSGMGDCNVGGNHDDSRGCIAGARDSLSCLYGGTD